MTKPCKDCKQCEIKHGIAGNEYCNKERVICSIARAKSDLDCFESKEGEENASTND